MTLLRKTYEAGMFTKWETLYGEKIYKEVRQLGRTSPFLRDHAKQRQALPGFVISDGKVGTEE